VGEVEKILEVAELEGIIHKTKRYFLNIKTLCFISLKLEIVSHECITWVLASLKSDEMTPTEKAVQSRIKEAFAHKISPSLWDYFLESFQAVKKVNQTAGKPPL
jgi:hypothetical protein